jgi:2,4-dienoyl-CoA reductase-like NADH-dependent reductase (Old Yellow Enzyme family)
MPELSKQVNLAAEDVPYYTPRQDPPAGTAKDPNNAPILFQPLTIKGIQFHNRVWVSPMCQYSAQDGMLTDWHLVNVGSYAARGAALTMIEASAVTPEGRITPEDSGIWDDKHIEPIKRIANFMRSQGSISAIQLAHAGRKASTEAPWLGGRGVSAEGNGWPDDVVGPSAIQWDETYPPVKELSVERIENIIAAFGKAAERALKAGIRVLEVHGAHGYLLHEFCSPISNKRTDDYGGSFENRVRFSLACTRAVREVIEKSGQQVPLFYRISASDWVEGGWSIEESVKLAKLLKEEGVDLLDVSSAGNSPLQQIKTGPGYQVHFAEQIKKEVPELLVGAVGMIWTAKLAEEVLQKGQADAIFVAREFLRDPSLPLTWAKELDVTVKWPIQYHRAPRPPQGAVFYGAGDERPTQKHGATGDEAVKASEKHHAQGV